MAETTSISLLERATLHDPESWSQLTRLYGPMVYAWARRHGLSNEDSVEVVQLVFASLAKSLSTFKLTEKSGSFRGWLWTVTRNKVRDYCRKHADEERGIGGTDFLFRLSQLPDNAPDPAGDEQERTQIEQLLHRALELVKQEFEERTWQAFWQVTVEARSTSEVGEDLGIAANSVRQAKSRVLRRLRAVLSDASDELSLN